MFKLSIFLGKGVRDQKKDAAVVVSTDGSPVLSASEGWASAGKAQKRAKVSRHPSRKRLKSQPPSPLLFHKISTHLANYVGEVVSEDEEDFEFPESSSEEDSEDDLEMQEEEKAVVTAVSSCTPPSV